MSRARITAFNALAAMEIRGVYIVIPERNNIHTGTISHSQKDKRLSINLTFLLQTRNVCPKKVNKSGTNIVSITTTAVTHRFTAKNMR